MMYAHIVVCFVVSWGLSDALLENCHIDNSICTKQLIPKLGVAYSGHRIACNDILHIPDTASKPTITFTHGNEGERYVLVFRDPDAPFPCANTDGSSILHYAAVVKLVSGELTPQQNLVSYHGPHPPSGTHRYQFYLFPWTSNQSPVIHNTDTSRHNFKLNQFVNENHLNQPVAEFQLRVTH